MKAHREAAAKAMSAKLRRLGVDGNKKFAMKGASHADGKTKGYAAGGMVDGSADIDGGMPKPNLSKPGRAKAKGKGGKGKTNVNVIVMGGAKPPGGPDGPMPPMPPGGPGGGPPMMPPKPPMMPPMGGPGGPPGGPPMLRKRGGRVNAKMKMMKKRGGSC